MSPFFEEAINKVTREITKEGFGNISEIDLKEKFKKKPGCARPSLYRK
ncbi:hypothetical protein Q0590_19090 [Rhodocytophaga aerolata]|uniref:Uncharacterized protein n=1 Tax=Rhodocytophaga aerolata TaxID=455078 RepID=A0ABT8RCG2_9BACT|nr:hypothetical protein [Rhodocytophaga aerolata]MDO1448390.1 hypothetical protein [Rhodocytophaga aerolata]